MPSPRRSRSRELHRSASFKSTRSSRIPSHRDATQQTSDTEHPSPRHNSSARRRSASPNRTAPPRPRSPCPSPSRTAYRKRFGLNVHNAAPKVPGKFDFEDKYPEDPINDEMGPDARLWRAFLDEMEVFNIDMVTESREGLDLLLVFAGIFSAVLSTFVAQTSQALSTNFPAISSSLLVEMVALQRAQINNTPIDDIPPADTNAGPSGFDICVNVLWFMSLTLSLGTALIAVLVRQWLYQYMSMSTGTFRDRSFIRYYRFEGLQKWHVLTIIGILPIFLHMALALFLAGLVIFLIPLNIPLALLVGFYACCAYAFYIISNILPIIIIQCPYRTPFSGTLNLVVMYLYKLRRPFSSVTMTSPNEDRHLTLKEMERLAATDEKTTEEVAWRALLWLYQMTSNPPTKRIIQESLGCLSGDVSKRSKVLQADLEQALREIPPPTASVDEFSGETFYKLNPEQEHRAERILRALRDPPTPPVRPIVPPHTSWELFQTDFSFQLLSSILVQAPHIEVKTELQSWDFPSLLYHLIEQQSSHTPVHLPPRLWTLLMCSDHTPWAYRFDKGFVAQLCMLAVKNFDNVKHWQLTIPPPFAGPVPVAHRTVPLLHLVVSLLVHHLRARHTPDSFGFEPLTELFTIYDYAALQAEVYLNSTATAPTAFLDVLSDIWDVIGRLDDLSENDKPILYQRIENAILHMTMNDEWWDSRDEGRHCRCYINVLAVYNDHKLAVCHSNSSEFFRKLLSDLSSLLTKDSREVSSHLSVALQNFLNQQPGNTSIFPLFCCASPFLSTQTPSSYTNCVDFLYPVISTLVEAAGKVPRDIVLQSLFAEPERFYTICWILTLGGASNHYDDREEHRRATFLQLARIDPTHVVWESRAHYMSMDPRDWPYLRLLDKDLEDEALWARTRMREGLQILDRFLPPPGAFPPVNSPAIQDAPPQNNTVPQSIPSSNPHWRHIRQLVSGTRALLGISSTSHSSPSDPTNVIELGLRREPSGAESAESDPHAEPGSRVLRSTTSHSSGASTAPSFRPRLRSTVSRPNHQLLLPALPCSASAIFLPQNTESNAVSAQALEMERDEAEVSSGESPQLNVHSSIRKTATSPSAFSNDAVSTHPLEPSFPKEAENVEVMSGEPSHSHILATIQDTPPLPDPPSSDYLYSTTSDVVISASIQSPPPGSLTNMALQRPPSAGSLHSRHSTNLDVDDTTFAELPNSPELPTEII